jgi:SAM-dependent methyltransferase
VKLLEIAKRRFPLPNAEHRLLDARDPFPFSSETVDFVLATMVFNEVSDRTLSHALGECHRVLTGGGKLLASVLHPAFVRSLAKRGLLERDRRGRLTMPGASDLRLPVVRRDVSTYVDLLRRADFDVEIDEIRPTPQLLKAKPRLRDAGDVPIALVLDARKTAAGPE